MLKNSLAAFYLAIYLGVSSAGVKFVILNSVLNAGNRLFKVLFLFFLLKLAKDIANLFVPLESCVYTYRTANLLIDVLIALL